MTTRKTKATDKAVASSLKKYFEVKVQFSGPATEANGWARTPTPQLYSYKTSFENLKAGDKVIVDAPSSGYTVVAVKEVRETDYVEAMSEKFSTWKPIVSLIDDVNYLESKAKAKRISELKGAMSSMKDKLDKEIMWKLMAKESPEFATMLKELQQLQG